MKNKTLICILLPVLAVFTANAQWQADNSFTTLNHLIFVSAQDPQSRFIVECDVTQSSWSSNWIHATNDGVKWTSLMSSEMCPGAVFMLNSQVGFMVTQGSAIGATGMIKTTDGGTTWQNINYTFPTSFQKGLFFTDEHTGYYGTGDGQTIHKTTDGGMTWTAKSTGNSSNTVIDAIWFTDANTGIIGGHDAPLLARTTDGGDSWTTVATQYHIYDLHFATADIGYAIATAAGTPVILKTIDGGAGWQEVYIGAATSLSAIGCMDEKSCYAVGDNGTILKTTDGGSTWQNETSGTIAMLNAVDCGPDRACYIAGNDGTLLKNTLGTGIEENTGVSEQAVIYPNPFSHSAILQLKGRVTDATLNITDAYGRNMHREMHINGTTAVLERGELAAGMYFFTCSDAHHTFRGSFLVQ